MNKLACLLCATGLILTFSTARAQQPEALSSSQSAIRNSAQAFVQAYDSGDAKAIASLWAEDAEYVVGQAHVKGRPAIQGLYEEFLKANPGSKMEIQIGSIRLLAPTVAIEEGTASVHGSPNGPPSTSTYTTVHVKQKDGKWLMTHVTESETPMPLKQDLDEIAWLVGDWSAQGDAAKVEIKNEWIANKNFICGETKMHAQDEAQGTIGGMQIIGRDPFTGQLVSWFFNADGGRGYGVWSKDGSRWLVQTQGTTAEGAPTTATNVLTRADDNTQSWQSINRIVGDQPLPNTSEIVIERVPDNQTVKH